MSLSSRSSAGSGEDSVLDDVTSTSPTPQTVGVSLDEYVCASKVGRAAFASGDLKTAVDQFDTALQIELRTEMDCLYDTSLGFVSGLVRQEVENRLATSPKHSPGPPSCDAMLAKLAEMYSEAEKQLPLKPTEAKWYLQMGACLCVADAWKQARQLYSEGLSLCKEPNDRKELARALKNLNKIEQVTSGISSPEPYESGLYAPFKPKPVPLEVHKRKGFKRFSIPKRKQRPKSEYVEPPEFDEDILDGGISTRHSSFSQEAKVGRHHSDPSPPTAAIVEKAAQKKSGMFGRMSLRRKRRSMQVPQPQLSIDAEELQKWVEAFGTQSSIAAGGQSFCPSAIIHMRRLSLESLSPALQRPVQVRSPNRPITFTSLKIEGDDSEIED